jgi:anti-sigma factor RsiW
MKEEETLEEGMMMGTDSAPSCACSEELVAYLYGEADKAAAQAFEAHALRCAPCRKELAEFRAVRAAVGEWRLQALGSLSPALRAADAPVAFAPKEVVAERQRSALAAIREFFTLSPAWMRAATVTLGLLFFALIALNAAYYFKQPKTVTVERIVEVKPSETELTALVNERLAQANTNAVSVPTVNVPTPVDTTQTVRRMAPRVNQSAGRERDGQPALVSTPATNVNISPRESREIARDLRLIASKEDDDLPRLSDLIDESN